MIRAAAVSIALALAGCGATFPNLGPPVPARTAGGLPLGEAPAVRLQSGQCALALWTLGAPATRIAIAVSQPASLRVNVNGRGLDLARSDYDGDPVFGHYPRQTWAGDGVLLTLRTGFSTREGMVGGAVTQDATLGYRGPDGEEMVIPVSGLVACQP